MSTEQYIDLLLHFNASSNLIGPMDRKTIRHDLIEDSLKAAIHVAPYGRVLDVGSGAGLPGLPLAIAYPDAHYTLVEPRKKRTQFMTIAAQRLGLRDRVDVVAQRIEDFVQSPDYSPFDWVVSKAFEEPTAFLRDALAWTKSGGHIISMISAADEAQLLELAKELPVEQVGTMAYESSEGQARRVITWRVSGLREM